MVCSTCGEKEYNKMTCPLRVVTESKVVQKKKKEIDY